MSDLSGHTDSEPEPHRYSYDDDSGDDRDRERDSRDGSGRSSSDSEDREDSDDDCSPSIDFQNLKFCDNHKAGQMTMDCSSCKAALVLIKDQNTVKLLTKNSNQSSFVSRYSGRCDDVIPTLLLSPATVEIAKNTFTKGMFKDKKSWLEIVKKYLTLPKAQHDILGADIKTEDILRKFKNEKRFQHIFKYQKDVLEGLRNLRIAQRPVLSLIEKTNDCIEAVRKHGETAGFQYPTEAPEKTSKSVPREGHKLNDNLHFSSSRDVFPRPDITDLVTSADLNLVQAEKVIAYIDGYKEDLVKQYMELYSTSADFLNNIEDSLVFYTDLYSHADATFRELIRDKMSTLFKPDIKSDVMLKTSARRLTEKPSGLFGGNLLPTEMETGFS